MAKFMRTTKGIEETNVASEATTTPDLSAAQDRRSAEQYPQKPELSFIGSSLKVTGNLESDTELRIAGKVEGDIKGAVVTVQEGAEITGSVYGETVIIEGRVHGKIEARTVVIGKTAHTTGDIIHDSLQIEAGAYVEGHCRPGFGKSVSHTGSFPRPAQSTAQPEAIVANKTA